MLEISLHVKRCRKPLGSSIDFTQPRKKSVNFQMSVETTQLKNVKKNPKTNKQNIRAWGEYQTF